MTKCQDFLNFDSEHAMYNKMIKRKKKIVQVSESRRGEEISIFKMTADLVRREIFFTVSVYKFEFSQLSRKMCPRHMMYSKITFERKTKRLSK